MKRRDFLTNTALLGAGIPLGMSSAVMTSCTQQQDAGKAVKIILRKNWVCFLS